MARLDFIPGPYWFNGDRMILAEDGRAVASICSASDRPGVEADAGEDARRIATGRILASSPTLFDALLPFAAASIAVATAAPDDRPIEIRIAAKHFRAAVAAVQAATGGRG